MAQTVPARGCPRDQVRFNAGPRIGEAAVAPCSAPVGLRLQAAAVPPPLPPPPPRRRFSAAPMRRRVLFRAQRVAGGPARPSWHGASLEAEMAVAAPQQPLPIALVAVQ